MKNKSPFDIINDLKTHATYLEGIAIVPNMHPDFARKMEISARLMRKASRMLELDDMESVPMFLRKQAR
jgi:urease gamma subunit